MQECKSIGIKKNITDLFNKVSTVYDSNGPKFFTYFGGRMVEFAEIKEGENVLDVASGKGASFFASIDKIGNEGKVTGIDIAEGMVNEINLEIQRRGMKNAEAIVMDAERLTFSNETFNHILCGFGVFFFPDYKVAFYEFMRVLKKGGKISFTTFLHKSDEKFKWLDELIGEYIPVFEDEIGDYQETDSPEFDTEEGLFHILTQAGFKNIQTRVEEKVFVYKDENEWWEKLWSHGFVKVLEMIPKDKMEDFKSDVFKKLSDNIEAEGIPATMYVLYAFGEK